MKFIKNNHNFQWIGEGIPFQKRGNKIRYEAFRIGCLNIGIGEFVLVRNDDALDPEGVISCYVAQVKDLFDSGDEFDPFQAQVQWFSRILELPVHAIRSLKTVDHHEYEIVQDKRSSWHDMIDAETVFQKCEILFLATDIDCEAALSEYIDHPFPVFFCRYTFTGVSLIPVKENVINHFQKSKLLNEINTFTNDSDSHNDEKVENSETLEKKRSYKKTEDMYCAIPTGSPKYPKLLIKKIDDKILQCENRNIRIFVADPSVGKVEDFTDMFLNKLKFEKQQIESLEKKPIIHNLSSQNNISLDKVCSTNEVMSDDSSVESETVKTPKNNISKKNFTPLNSKSCKKLFAYSTRNSPRKISDIYPTPKKKVKVSYQLDDLSLNKSRNKMTFSSSDEEDITETFSSKLKIKDIECNNNLEKRHLIHSLKSQKNVEDLKFETNSEYEVNPQTPKSRKSCALKKTATPKSHRKVFDASPRNSPNKYVVENSDTYSTPKKKAKFSDVVDNFCLTRSGRRVKPINYAENLKEIISIATPTKKKMPRFVRSNCSDDSDSSNFSADEDSSDDSSVSGVSIIDEISPNKRKISLKKNKRKTSSKKNDVGVRISSSKKNVDLCIPERKTPSRTPKNALEESRQRLHVSAVPNSLPCREEEYSDIYSFVKGCLCAQTGGCMYISGVPGTGKTATVHEVMRNLEEEKESGDVPIFTFVEVNGMWMTDPYQCYVQIFKALTGKNIAPQQAADLLEKRFTERGPKKDAVVLLVDELDRLWTRKQTVMYNIFEWPTKKNSKLIVLAIANTMDLPERMMMNRISSRLGLTRKTFQPYTFRQLQEILMSRIQELKVFDPDAVQLVARKVAAVSGDARRALDICRFATETVKVKQTSKKGQKVLVGMEHVDIALQQMFSSPVISAIRSSSKITKLFFQCILSEFTRSGLEETTLLKVYQQVVSTCRFEGFHPPNSTEISRICSDLAASHLILVDNFRNDLYMKIRLNISSDDVTYALTLK